MKVYKFFKIPEEYEKDDIDIERKYSLYAITNDKKLANRFKSERNMKKFIFKAHEGIDTDEYADMCNINRGCVLGLYPLTTVFDDNHTRKNSVQKKLLMTYYENQMSDDCMTLLDDESLWASMPYPLIFKSKYQKMLDTLQYTTYYKLMTVEKLPYSLAERLVTIDDDYSAPMIEHDEVALFIKMIIDTL